MLVRGVGQLLIDSNIVIVCSTLEWIEESSQPPAFPPFIPISIVWNTDKVYSTSSSSSSSPSSSSSSSSSCSSSSCSSSSVETGSSSSKTPERPHTTISNDLKVTSLNLSWRRCFRKTGSIYHADGLPRLFPTPPSIRIYLIFFLRFFFLLCLTSIAVP